MIVDAFKDSSHFVKLILILFLVLVVFVAVMVIGFLVAIPLFGIEFSNFKNAVDINNPENIGLLKFLQSIYSIGLFVIPPFVIALFLGGKTSNFLKLNKPPKSTYVFLGATTIVFAMPLINFMVEINQAIEFPEFMSGFENLMKDLEGEAKISTDNFLKTDTFFTYLVNLIVLAIIPALGEEFMFRGVIQQHLHSWTKNIHLAIWLSAFIFSAIHFQFYGLIPRMVLGAFFGYLFYWTKNLWLPVVIHFFNNAFAVTAKYISGDIAIKADEVGTGNGSGWIVLLSFILVASLIYVFYRLSREEVGERGVPN